MTDTAPANAIGCRLVSEVLTPMKRAFVGKDEIIDLLGVCLVAGENLFILGGPGTAKSALVFELGRRQEGRTFEYLLTRFTEPGEIFGPFDIRKLREGDLVTNTEGMLPEASLVFLDELLNANSAILNSLLMVLNERVFRRGRETRRLPVLMVVGASNRLPEDDALAALFDRFLLRVTCENVPRELLGDVLAAGWKLDLGLHARGKGLDIEEVRRLHGELAAVDVAAIRGPLKDLVLRLRGAGIALSDRRAVKLQRIVAASALLCGRMAAIVADLWVVRHTWETVEQREIIAGVVDQVLAAAPPAPAEHPRARAAGAPDKESLAQELAAIAEGLAQHAGAADRSALRDRLAIVAGRCQWVQEEEARRFLCAEVEGLWQRFDRIE